MAYCRNCHAELEPGAIFCAECGRRAETGPDPSVPPDPFPVPEPSPVPVPEEERPLKVFPGIGVGIHVWIYRDRIEVRREKKKDFEPVVVFMRDIMYAQFHRGSIWVNPYVQLLMKDGKKLILVRKLYSKEANRELEEISELLNSHIRQQ